MKNNSSKFHILFFVTLTIIFFQACTQASGESKIKKVKKFSQIPFFVTTGFSSPFENISVDSLKKLMIKKKVSVHPNLAEKIQKYFNLDSLPKTSTFEKFIPTAKTNLWITDLENLTCQLKTLSIDDVNFFKKPMQYKLMLNEDGNPFDYQSTITKYMHTGVTAITRSAGVVADAKGIQFLTKNLKPYFDKADYTHMSNEVSLKDSCNYKSMVLQFATKRDHFEALNILGADIIELTGNHNLDVGKGPYKESMKWYQENNMQTFGGGLSPEEANKPLIITLKDGKKLGFIGFNELCPCNECADKEMGANRYNAEKAKKVISKMKNEMKIDWVIACVQYGESDSYLPTPSQEKISKDLIDFGADMLCGSQAHQVQAIEFYKGKPLFYGLGNFLFDQIHREGVRQAYFLECYFFNGKLVQSYPVFTYMTSERQQTIANTKQKEVMQKAIYFDAKLYK